MIDIPVVEVVQVPQAHVAEKTVEIRQLDVVEKIVETPEIQTGHSIQGRIQQRTLEQIVDTPIPQVLAEAPKDFSQNRVQQSSMEQTIANPATSLAEETVEMPVIRTKEKTQHVVNTHVQQVVQQTVDIPSSTMTDSSRDAQMQVPTVQVAQKTVKEIRSKFEVEHTSEVHARNRSDKNRWREKQRFEAKQYPQDEQERADLMNQRQVLAIRSVQKTVEVPRVQYIDKVADIPVDVQRQGSTNQAPQYIDEVVDVPVPTQSVAPSIPDTDDLCLNETADEDRLEHENKKRKLPTPAEAVSESRADESDFDRFDDLVLPSPEGKDPLREHRLW